MFDKLTARAEAMARRRAAARAAELAAGIEAERLPGLRVEAFEAGVRLSGRGLARRHALDPRLRGLVAGLAR